MSNALKTINDKKFNDVFIEITHSEDLGTTNNKELRLFRMKEIIDNEFSKDALNKFVSRNIGHYVFSRSKVKEYYDEDDEMSAGVEALDLMWATGDADQKGTGNELGEVLLYAFLESVLDAPKIYSKVELNRTVRSGNSNCDSIHLKVLPQTGNTLNFEMVFGSSSVVGDLGIAIDNAFEQVKRIKGHRSDEMKIVDQTVFDLPEDDPIAVQIQEIITPKEGTAVNRDSAYGIFLGYTIGLRKDRPDYRQAVDKKMEADIKKYLPQLQNHIKTLGLTGRSFYVYIVPFDDAETDKNTVMKKGDEEGRLIMAEKRKKSFGEVYFSELNQNEYLRKIYDDILYNYALKVFGFTNRKKKEIPIEHALQFADLLSKSNHSTLADEQKMWAQEIITMLLYVYDEDPRVSYMAGSVLEAVGNYQGIDIAKSTYNGTDILDRLASEYKKDYYAIPGEDGKYFMAAQKTAFDSFSTEYFSYSGPTSMGKSYIMRMFIKQQIMSGVKKNYALVVPTKALINEVRKKVTEDLNDNLHEFQYHIITAAGDAALESEEKNRNYIFIMTPERLLYLLINEKDIHLDYLFIDEAHKLSGADKRSTFYYQFVHMLSDREDKPRIFFASPNVPNPEIYLKLISDVDTETLLDNRMSSRFSPVSQEKFLINLVGKEVSVYNEHTKEAIPLTSIAIEDADLIDVLLRFEKDRNGKEVQCIVYFPSTRKTVTAARDFAANRVERTECKELMDLANDIKNEVHGDYYLVDLIKKGVAYHIGYLPSSIRQRIENLFKDGLITALFCTSTLIEGVNLPADNLFVTDFKNGKKHMKAVDFRNLIGRVGRLEYNLYGNVFLVAANEKAEEKYEELLKEDIKPQALSVEKGLTKPQKRNVIEALLAGTVEFEEYPKGKQSEDSYDLMRKFGIALLNDILMDRNTLVRREFAKVMKPGEEEKIRDNFRNRTEYLQENDITVSVDQSESLYQAISDQTHPLEFPKVLDDGSFDYDELTAFLNRLCRIFKWDLYESETLGHIGKYSHKHGRLMWYQVILAQWVRGRGLSTIMYQAIKNKEDNPKNAMYIDREYVDYDSSKNHENIVISDVLSVIDEVILFKLSNYFLKVSKAYTEIKGKEPEHDWYEYVEYGSTNKRTINIQKHGFSRESAIYILEHPEAGIVKQEKPLRLSWKAIQECKNEGVKNDAELIKYNIPELFE